MLDKFFLKYEGVVRLTPPAPPPKPPEKTIFTIPSLIGVNQRLSLRLFHFMEIDREFIVNSSHGSSEYNFHINLFL